MYQASLADVREILLCFERLIQIPLYDGLDNLAENDQDDDAAKRYTRRAAGRKKLTVSDER